MVLGASSGSHYELQTLGINRGSFNAWKNGRSGSCFFFTKTRVMLEAQVGAGQMNVRRRGLIASKTGLSSAHSLCNVCTSRAGDEDTRWIQSG